MATRRKKLTAEPLLVEAREVFEEIENHESDYRERWADDLRFVAGEQWPEDMRRFRESTSDGGAPRPCLVVDQTNQYRRQVINDARLNPPSLMARPRDERGSVEVADDLQRFFRYIEEASRAQEAYLNALQWAVDIGRGFFRVYAEEVDADRNFWEPRIGRIDNALAVYFDAYSTEIDGSDAFDAFVVLDTSPRRFKRQWPKAQATEFIGLDRHSNWVTKDVIRVAEWDRKVVKSERRVVTADGEYTPDEAKALELADFREEDRESVEVWRRKITATDILEEHLLPIESVGVIPVYGNVYYVDGRRDIKGLIAGAKDPQRLLNYAVSSMAERISLEAKTPWVTPFEAVAGFEAEWESANIKPKAYLPYNHVDDQMQPIPAPSRQPMDTNFSGWVQLVQQATNSIQASLGMYQAAVGAASNETSGRAIRERSQQSDVATYHYVANLSASIRHGGRLVLDMIPRLYDVPRTIRLLAENGDADTAEIDPNSPEPLVNRERVNGRATRVLNPTIGKYDVVVSVGPSFSSRREEAATRIGEMLAQNPNLAALVGDIFFAYQDWPGADEVAARLKKALPPELQDDEDEEIAPEIAQRIQQIVKIMEARDQAAAETMQTVIKAADKLAKEKMGFQVEAANLRAVQADLERQKADIQSKTRELASAKSELDALIAAARVGATPNGFGE